MALEFRLHRIEDISYIFLWEIHAVVTRGTVFLTTMLLFLIMFMLCVQVRVVLILGWS